jgi:hypothetical protein
VRAFPAFRLPGGPDTIGEVPPGEGEILLRVEPDAEEAAGIVDGLVEAGAYLRARGNAALTRVLGRASGRLLDRDDPLRVEAEAWLPRESGLSPEMAGLVLDRMAADWSSDALTRLLSAELPEPRVLEGFRSGPEGDRVRAIGDRFAFHVGAGNVPGVGATSVVRSLLARTPLLLKPGRGDVVLPVLLARAIAEEDPELGEAVAVVYWPGGSRPALEEEALRRAERVVVYGGADTVEELRSRIDPRIPLVAYRHRVSAAAVGRERLTSEPDARRVARDAAEAVAAYDQRGCVSPHLFWVEEGGTVGPERWAELLAEALSELGERLPPGPADPAVAARIQQLRGAGEMREAAGGGGRVLASEGVAWTVLYEPGAGLEAGCSGRTARVRPVERLEEVPQVLAEWGDLVQSVALEAEPERRVRVAEALAGIGVSRMTTLRRQAWPSPWWLHDGRGPLRVLLRWATLEGG